MQPMKESCVPKKLQDEDHLWKPSIYAHEPLATNIDFITLLIRENIHPRLVNLGTGEVSTNSYLLTRIGGILTHSFSTHPLIGCDISESLHVDSLVFKPEIHTLVTVGDLVSDNISCDSSGNNLRDFALVRAPLSRGAALKSLLSRCLPPNVRTRTSQNGEFITYKFYRDEAELPAEASCFLLKKGFSSLRYLSEQKVLYLRHGVEGFQSC